MFSERRFFSFSVRFLVFMWGGEEILIFEFGVLMSLMWFVFSFFYRKLKIECKVFLIRYKVVVFRKLKYRFGFGKSILYICSVYIKRKLN